MGGGLEGEVVFGLHVGASIGDDVAAGDGDVVAFDQDFIGAEGAANGLGLLLVGVGGGGAAVEEAAAFAVAVLAGVLDGVAVRNGDGAGGQGGDGALGAVEGGGTQVDVLAAVELDVAVGGDAGAVFGVDAGVAAVAGVPLGVPLGGVAAVGVEGAQV
ncbi:hypothetical protein RA12_09355 [Xylella fastidiosa]|nr:hypothetical protein RA12_09620 [Xylella fastidiosa]KIA57855.1 hypothetical protein RA12_09355 [Xylella fastidiosa]